MAYSTMRVVPASLRRYGCCALLLLLLPCCFAVLLGLAPSALRRRGRRFARPGSCLGRSSPHLTRIL